MPAKQTIEKINKKRGALSDRQATAVGLSKARQGGRKVVAPGKKDSSTSDTRAKSRKTTKLVKWEPANCRQNEHPLKPKP
jgi:hypothetical protein